MENARANNQGVPGGQTSPRSVGPVSARSRALILLASILSLALVSYLDYATGNDLLFFVFYFVPVALCGWFLGLPSTLGLSALSGFGWFAVDRLSGHYYPHEFIGYWNSVICFVAFAAMGLLLHYLPRTQLRQQQAQEELSRALEDLRRSTEEIRSLQSELQVVCAWTKRIRINGQWIPLEKFLSDKLHLSISHSISPEALERLTKTLDEESPH